VPFNKFDSQQFVGVAFLGQLIEQRLGFFEIGGVEALGEPEAQTG
jgi:hypothetical protein